MPEGDRDIVEVIDAIRAVEELPEKVKDRLKCIAHKAGYSAPEMQRTLWIEVGAILQHDVGEPDCEWKQTVQDIFVGKAG